MDLELEKDFLVGDIMKETLFAQNGVLFLISYEEKLSGLQALSKDEFGYCGGFPFQEICLLRIYEMYIDESIVISKQAIIYILAQSLSLVWEKTIAHEENKKKASVVVPIVTKILQKFAEDLEKPHFKKAKIEIARMCISSLWSFCYGIVENHAIMFHHGAIPLLVDLFKYEQLEYNISGTLWHLFESSYICEEVLKLNGLRYLSDIPHKQQSDSGLVASLALSRLSRFGSQKVQEHLFKLNALESIVDWVKNLDLIFEGMDINTFYNPFVWTTMKPLLELLNSEYYQVRLLGCFLLVVTLKNCEKVEETGEYTQGKLLFEGATSLLRNIIANEQCDLIIKYASMAASEFIPLKDISMYRSKGMLWNLLKYGASFRIEELKVTEDCKAYYFTSIPFILGWRDQESVISILPFDVIQYTLKMLYSI